MLVLTRKMGEVVTIGDQIRIKVVEMKGNQVRLGIEAPGDMRIYREEIYVKVQRENQLASAWNLTDLEAAVTYLAAGNKE
ncbi:carbon storage regulator CsrA [Geobacter pickeringii]|uniref:Translational regulator CsrA n=1 Tax=Geobacter pickeringii TaxID=345632 RepID=A0A0B5BCX3_9BACT|nr:carbon storage regulator CsrA [Geobacter pickeringii]AJE02395.1 carbon storage regulator [Geobacter pickeringii]